MPDRDSRKTGWQLLLPRQPRQLGHRGAILFVLGALWIVVGLGVVTSKSGGISPEQLLHEQLPANWRGWAWILTGALAMVYAWRPTGFKDGLGFAALYLMPAIRVMSYLIAWVQSWSWPRWSWWPWADHPGYELGWRFAALYGAQLAAVIICATWPEPPHKPRRPTGEPPSLPVDAEVSE